VNIRLGITGWRRPDYFEHVLTGLAANPQAGEFECVAAIDYELPVLQQRHADLFRASGLRGHVHQHARRLGCAGNVGFVLRTAFADPAVDAVIMLEDDTVPSPDFLGFVSAQLERFAADESVFSVTGYHRRVAAPPPQLPHHPTSLGDGDPARILRRPWFTSWGWATWRRTYEEIGERWFGIRWRGRPLQSARDVPEGEPFLDLVHPDPNGSWAWPMNCYWRRGRDEIAPDLSRIQNIGSRAGAFCPGGDWHRRHQHTEYWMGDGRAVPESMQYRLI
jgi:hypothetical protein